MARDSSTKEYRTAYMEQYRRTPHGAAMCAWNRLTARAGAKYNFSQCYASIEVKMTRDEFAAWATPVYEAWFRDHPDVTPSLDRIDSAGHYELGNLQLIPLDDNRQKTSHFKNRVAPDGQLWCGNCKQYLPIDSFYIDRQKKTGRSTYCIPCVPKVRERQKRARSNA